MLKKVVSFLLFSQVALAGNTVEEIKNRCAPSPSGPVLYSGDFKWGYNFAEMMQSFTSTYSSPKRLAKKAFWDVATQSIKLPYDEFRGGDIQVSTEFINSVARHIEKAFEHRYVDAVFFPDMGHSHLLIPQELMDEKYDKYPVREMSRMYEAMFADSRIKVLYHTAEQLQALDKDGNVLPDKHIQWRHHTRNIVGENHSQTDLMLLQNPESRANTVNGLEGHRWWGAGFNLSANKDGCFEFSHRGQKYYFDLSMYDLESENSSGDW